MTELNEKAPVDFSAGTKCSEDREGIYKLKPGTRPAEILITMFAERWPACFHVYEKRRRPLAIGIHKEIIAALDGVADKTAIENALAFYVGNFSYLGKIKAGRERIALDGKPAGAVTDEEERNAIPRIMARKRRKEAKFKERQAAQQPTATIGLNGKITQAGEQPSAAPGLDGQIIQAPASSHGTNPNAAKPRLTLRRRS
jgi:sRNA-binding protein